MAGFAGLLETSADPLETHLAHQDLEYYLKSLNPGLVLAHAVHSVASGGRNSCSSSKVSEVTGRSGHAVQGAAGGGAGVLGGGGAAHVDVVRGGRQVGGGGRRAGQGGGAGGVGRGGGAARRVLVLEQGFHLDL